MVEHATYSLLVIKVVPLVTSGTCFEKWPVLPHLSTDHEEYNSNGHEHHTEIEDRILTVQNVRRTSDENEEKQNNLNDDRDWEEGHTPSFRLLLFGNRVTVIDETYSLSNELNK